MQSRRGSIQLLFPLVVALFWLHGIAVAQSRPTPPGFNITGSTNLSQSDLATLRSYVEYWINVMKNPASSPEEVETARTELLRPLSNPGLSNSFRYEYAKLMEPGLRQASEAEKCHVAINALITAAETGTDRCANLLLDNVDVHLQPLWQVRLQAAAGCAVALRGGTLESRKVLEASRRLLEASQGETNPLILRHQLAGILAAELAVSKPEERQQVRNSLVEAISAAVNKAEKSPDRDAMIEAVTLTVINLRNRFIDSMTDPERRDLGPRLAPILGKMMAMASTSWENAQNDPRTKRNYGVTIGACQGFLARIHTVAGGEALNTQVREAWDAGDKAKFDAELQKWLLVLQQPPYSRAG